MLEFYGDERVSDCELDEDGDMLLYEWGTYDWGAGHWFNCQITRQFIPRDGGDEDIFQLTVTAKYTPSSQTDALGSGNKWCGSPSELATFTDCVLQSKSLRSLRGKPCEKLVTEYNGEG